MVVNPSGPANYTYGVKAALLNRILVVLAFVGLFQGDVAFNDPNFHRRELTLLASRNALPGDFTRIIRLIESGRIDTAPWITHRASLAAVPSEFPAWALPKTGVIKAMIEV